MADGMEQAAQAFDTAINETPSRPEVQRTPDSPASERPVERLFDNIGKLDKDTDSKGGGDTEEIDPEEALYGKRKTPRNSRKEDAGPRDGDDDESDGDDDDESSDGDEDSEEEEEEDEGANAAADLTRKVEVVVDGEPKEVTLKEALEGYVRTETFHQRMNQLDEAKKIVRRAAADAVQNYEYSTNLAKQMQAHMEQMIPKEPDWDEEFKKDPVHARDLQRYYEKAKAFQGQMQTQMVEANQKLAQSNAAQLKAFAEEETQKFEAANRKTWSDPSKKAKDLDSMRRTGLAHGFTEEELSQVYDSRMLQILLKASKYDRMMAAKPKPVVRQQAKPIPPGTGSARQRTVQKGVTSAMKKLNRTGSIEDASLVFDQIIARS